jgi:hypothetical protein
VKPADSKYAPLVALWQPANQGRKWRLRLVSGGIVVLDQMRAHDDEGGSRSATGRVVRVMRPIDGRALTPGQDARFEFSELRDVADQDRNAMVYPAGRATAARPAVKAAGKGSAGSPVQRALAVIVLFAALMVFGRGLARWREIQAHAAWPVAGGRIERLYIRSDGLETMSSEATHTLDLLYRYRVAEDDVREGTRLSLDFEGQTKDEESLYYRLRDYQVGDSVRVHYDPRDPNRAVIEIEGRDVAYGLMAIAVAMLVIAWMFWGGRLAIGGARAVQNEDATWGVG